MLGVRVRSTNGNRTDVLAGFGLGYQVTRALDFKTQLYFRDVAHDRDVLRDPRSNWGFGAGIEVRIE